MERLERAKNSPVSFDPPSAGSGSLSLSWTSVERRDREILRSAVYGRLEGRLVQFKSTSLPEWSANARQDLTDDTYTLSEQTHEGHKPLQLE